jgi:AcrR family transcriptional regulator
MTEAPAAAATRHHRSRRAPRPSGEERHRAILETAERLLAERGLDGFSVDDLARGAGLSRPTFYFYFASKEAVLLTLLDRVIDEVNARSADLPAAFEGDPAGSWRRVIQGVVEVFAGHRSVATAAVQAHLSTPAVRQLWTQTMGTWIGLVADVIEAERARGAAPDGVPAHDLATALNLMNERVLVATFTGEACSITEDAVTDVLLGIWLNSIYGPGGPTGG